MNMEGNYFFMRVGPFLKKGYRDTFVRGVLEVDKGVNSYTRDNANKIVGAYGMGKMLGGMERYEYIDLSESYCLFCDKSIDKWYELYNNLNKVSDVKLIDGLFYGKVIFDSIEQYCQYMYPYVVRLIKKNGEIKDVLPIDPLFKKRNTPYLIDWVGDDRDFYAALVYGRVDTLDGYRKL